MSGKATAAGRTTRLPEAWHTKPLKGDVTNIRCLVPGKDGQPVSRKGAIIDRQEFAAAQSEYYRIRGWDDRGYQSAVRTGRTRPGGRGAGTGGSGPRVAIGRSEAQPWPHSP